MTRADHHTATVSAAAAHALSDVEPGDDQILDGTGRGWRDAPTQTDAWAEHRIREALRKGWGQPETDERSPL